MPLELHGIPLVPLIIGNFISIMFRVIGHRKDYGVKGVGGILLEAISEQTPTTTWPWPLWRFTQSSAWHNPGR